MHLVVPHTPVSDPALQATATASSIAGESAQWVAADSEALSRALAVRGHVVVEQVVVDGRTVLTVTTGERPPAGPSGHDRTTDAPGPHPGRADVSRP